MDDVWIWAGLVSSGRRVLLPRLLSAGTLHNHQYYKVWPLVRRVLQGSPPIKVYITSLVLIRGYSKDTSRRNSTLGHITR